MRIESKYLHKVATTRKQQMIGLYDQIEEAKGAIRSRWHATPQVGIILGTGLGGLTEDIATQATIDYAAVPHFPRSTVITHAGRLVCGKLSGKTVVAMEGRFHAYEGYTLKQI